MSHLLSLIVLHTLTSPVAWAQDDVGTVEVDKSPAITTPALDQQHPMTEGCKHLMERIVHYPEVAAEIPEVIMACTAILKQIHSTEPVSAPSNEGYDSQDSARLTPGKSVTMCSRRVEGMSPVDGPPVFETEWYPCGRYRKLPETSPPTEIGMAEFDESGSTLTYEDSSGLPYNEDKFVDIVGGEITLPFEGPLPKEDLLPNPAPEDFWTGYPTTRHRPDEPFLYQTVATVPREDGGAVLLTRQDGTAMFRVEANVFVLAHQLSPRDRRRYRRWRPNPKKDELVEALDWFPDQVCIASSDWFTNVSHDVPSTPAVMTDDQTYQVCQDIRMLSLSPSSAVVALHGRQYMVGDLYFAGALQARPSRDNQTFTISFR